MTSYTINLDRAVSLSDEQFYQICQNNPDLKFERNALGELIVMPPTGGGTGRRNFDIGVEFGLWNRQTCLGVCFDSSTCFKLPNGADRSPDIAWIRQDRWDALTTAQQETFPPIAPDFVLELMSPTDSLKQSQAKMLEYMVSGVRLGWLIDRKNRQVEIYREGQAVQVLVSPQSVSGGDILVGFELKMNVVW
jgi:Uma2 family endonuclease